MNKNPSFVFFYVHVCRLCLWANPHMHEKDEWRAKYIKAQLWWCRARVGRDKTQSIRWIWKLNRRRNSQCYNTSYGFCGMDQRYLFLLNFFIFHHSQFKMRFSHHEKSINLKFYNHPHVSPIQVFVQRRELRRQWWRVLAIIATMLERMICSVGISISHLLAKIIAIFNAPCTPSSISHLFFLISHLSLIRAENRERRSRVNSFL